MPFSELGPGDPPTVGPYRLNGRLGAGGMGVVYLAFGPGGESVALKLLRPDLLDDPEYRARFAGEVAAAGAVTDPRVVRLVAAEIHGAHPWMATEYVEGPTLLQAVEGTGPLPDQRLRAVAGDLAAALEALHAVGLVHRDLKPANIVLAWDGPKLIDLGIAKYEDVAGHTGTGVAIGSLPWLCPEVLNGYPATRASDVFGWGLCVAYAGTGRMPFGTGEATAVAYRVTHGTADLTGLSAFVRDRVAPTLAPDPRARPTADELRRAFAFGHEPTRIGPAHTEIDPGPPPRRPPAGRRRLVIGLAAVLLLAIAGGVVGVVLAARPSSHAKATTSAGQPTTAEPTSPVTSAPLGSGPSATSADPTTDPTEAVTEEPTPPAIEPAASLAAAEQVVLGRGYRPHPDDGEYWDPAAPVNVIIGTAAGSADGKDNWPFFFVGSRYIGHDSITSSAGVRVEARTADEITLSYAMYGPRDALCCPSGRQAVRYAWTGARLVPLDPIPPTDGDYHR